VGGRAKIGLGLGVLSDRSAGGAAAQRFEAFVAHLRRLGVLENDPSPATLLPGRLGGWLKMGIVGTSPGRGRVLLVGDAAGLVNPLQGGGIGGRSHRSCVDRTEPDPELVRPRIPGFMLLIGCRHLGRRRSRAGPRPAGNVPDGARLPWNPARAEVLIRPAPSAPRQK